MDVFSKHRNHFGYTLIITQLKIKVKYFLKNQQRKKQDVDSFKLLLENKTKNANISKEL